MDESKLKNEVNRQGFPLQIALESLIKNTNHEHNWRVLFSEHSWVHFQSKENGFIDLVLENKAGGRYLIVECKRVQNTNWIFLQGETDINSRTHAKVWVTRKVNEIPVKFGWFDTNVDPATAESKFCAIPGQDPKSRPMLERLTSEVISSTESFAAEDLSFHQDFKEFESLYFSAIVTTAELMVCNFDPGKVNISNGEIDDAKFTKVPYLRFRKQLSKYMMPVPSLKELTVSEIARHKENTVFVINSDRFIDFLKVFCD